jgi:serine/threonine protein kinase
MPTATEYNQAIQNLHVTAADQELKAGEPALNPLGLPLEYSGGFAVVYQVRCPKTGKTWAVKCFTKEVEHRHERYDAISRHLRQARLPFMVGFEYQETGLLVNGRWHPIVKMDWIEGAPLNRFVAEHLEDRGTLRQLQQLWVKLARRLEAAEVAHADLQHGNVLLVPPAREGEGPRLRLVDYDGIHVPALAARPSGELGHRAYQHPQRLREGIYSAAVDRFSHLAIYCAIHCLLAGGRSLWERYDNQDNLLFREPDFTAPGESELFQRLWAVKDGDLRALVGHLILATQEPLDRVPLLDEIVTDGSVRPLQFVQEQQVARLLGAGRPPHTPVTVPEPPPIPEGAASQTTASTLAETIAPAIDAAKPVEQPRRRNWSEVLSAAVSGGDRLLVRAVGQENTISGRCWCFGTVAAPDGEAKIELLAVLSGYEDHRLELQPVAGESGDLKIALSRLPEPDPLEPVSETTGGPGRFGDDHEFDWDDPGGDPRGRVPDGFA